MRFRIFGTITLSIKPIMARKRWIWMIRSVLALILKIYFVFSMWNIVAVIRKGEVAYHFVDSFGFVELKDFGRPIIQIGHFKCYLVDEWEGCGERFQLGSSPTCDLVFYFALAKPSGIDIEYDFRPTHDEVEDDWINEMAAIDIAAHDL